MRIPDDDIYVWWKDGIWKIHSILYRNTLRIRWVRGPRPAQRILRDVHQNEVTPLNNMEVLGLMADDEILP